MFFEKLVIETTSAAVHILDLVRLLASATRPGGALHYGPARAWGQKMLGLPAVLFIATMRFVGILYSLRRGPPGR